MLRLDKLIIKVGEWQGRNIAYGGESAKIGELEIDLRDYEEFHGAAIATEVLRMAGDNYSNYPMDKIRNYINNVIANALSDAGAVTSSLVTRYAVESDQSGFASNDESTLITTNMTVVFVKV